MNLRRMGQIEGPHKAAYIVFFNIHTGEVFIKKVKDFGKSYVGKTDRSEKAVSVAQDYLTKISPS